MSELAGSPVSDAGDPVPVENQCEMPDCVRKYTTIIDTRFINVALLRKLDYPDTLALCDQCYRKLKAKDGVILGYKTRDTKTIRFVQEELF